MPRLTHVEYDALERAVVDGARVAIRRRGHREQVVIPLRLSVKSGREVIETRNPTTGHQMEIDLDDVEHLEVVR
jgi:hypothetical protein